MNVEYDDTDRDDDGNKIMLDPSVKGGGKRRGREIMKKVGWSPVCEFT